MAEGRKQQKEEGWSVTTIIFCTVCAIVAGVSVGEADMQLSAMHYARDFDHPEALAHAKLIYRLALGLAGLAALSPFVVNQVFKEKKK